MLNTLLPECEEACYIGVLPSIFVGIAFCIIYPTIIGVIPVVVDETVMGTAFGIAGCSYNYPDFLSPLIGSTIHDHTLDIKEGYFWVNYSILNVLAIFLLGYHILIRFGLINPSRS